MKYERIVNPEASMKVSKAMGVDELYKIYFTCFNHFP